MRRGLVVNVALAVVSSAVFLAVLEGAARLLEKPRPPRREVADYIWDWDDKMPGGFYVMKSDGVGWPPWEEFNRDGLRDRTRPHEKAEGLRRVAVLGDSVTLGADLRPDEAYPQRLEARFRAEGRRVEVMNVALWGWSTRQERTAWQRVARTYRPDQAILAVCLNDVPELFNNLSRPPRWLTRLHERSALVRLLVDAEGREIDSVERLFAEPGSPRVQEAMNRFFEEVRALRRDVEADGAGFAVVVFPFRFQVSPGAPTPVVQERIAAFCEFEKLKCLDLLPTLERVGPSAFVDYDHLSPAGASLVADTLYAGDLLGGGESVADLLRGALGDRATDVSALASALASAGSTGVRVECAGALGALGPAARGAVPALFVALGDRSEAVRAAAARGLTGIGPTAEDVPRLVDALGSDDPYVVAFAAWSLGNLGSQAQSAVPDLGRALARDDTNAVVAGALARIGPAAAAAVGVLVEGLHSTDADRRWRAARTLGRIGPPAASAVPSLTQSLTDSSSLARLHAARALGRIGHAARPAAAALQRATGDADPNVGEEARQALARLHQDPEMNPCVQERYAPRNHCFGCGPSNPHGLHVRSFEDGEGLSAEWTPEPHHEAFAGAVSGGILGTLLDCHSNWTAAIHLMRSAGRDRPPCTVTAEFHVRLLRVTPSTGPLSLRARVVESAAGRATVEATVEAGGKTTATCRGVFVAVKEGHPAFHRW